MVPGIRTILGLLCVAAGLLAVPVPVVPGIPLILAGVALLGTKHPILRSLRAWLRSRGIGSFKEEQP